MMSTAQPGMSVVAVRGWIGAVELCGLLARVCASETAVGEVVLDLDSVPADATTVEALARVQLAARRHGRRVRLRNATPELLELVRLMGLADVLTD